MRRQPLDRTQTMAAGLVWGDNALEMDCRDGYNQQQEYTKLQTNNVNFLRYTSYNKDKIRI